MVETAYNWRPTDDFKKNKPPFPETPEGQLQFLKALKRVIDETPDGRCLGLFWWEPMATGSIAQRALFDREGNSLPAIGAFASEAAR